MQGVYNGWPLAKLHTKLIDCMQVQVILVKHVSFYYCTIIFFVSYAQLPLYLHTKYTSTNTQAVLVQVCHNIYSVVLPKLQSTSSHCYTLISINLYNPLVYGCFHHVSWLCLFKSAYIIIKSVGNCNLCTIMSQKGAGTKYTEKVAFWIVPVLK